MCYPESFEDCVCDEDNPTSFVEDAFSEHHFIECSSGALLKCPLHESFDSTKERCMTKFCKTAGMFQSPDDCRNYYKCVETSEGLLEVPLKCEETEHFNPITEECEDACNKDYSNEFECISEGRYPDLYDCRKFHECVNNAVEDVMEYREKFCPHGTHWKPMTESEEDSDLEGRISESEEPISRACVRVEKSDCKPMSRSTCTKPDTCPASKKI